MTPLSLSALQISRNTRPRRRRVGRGNASRGTYSGRGLKGQRSRSGGRRGMIRRSLRSLMERVPKVRGFRSRRIKYTTVGLDILDRSFKNGEVVTPTILVQRGIIQSARRGLKVLGNGTLSKSLTVQAHAFSESARTVIQKSGGQAVLLRQAAANSPPKD
ncbi:MAG: 50S ribosomal protein L15 [Candidatus Kerfeldbacteria bacterium]|nr:50S ribosomal protein L15 [Candidatus Kerfeldbacteria bacterium]